MRRVLANELVRLIDRRFRLAVLVIRVEQVELPLLRFLAERIARLERLEPRDRVLEILVAQILDRLHMDELRRSRDRGYVAAAAAAG